MTTTMCSRTKKHSLLTTCKQRNLCKYLRKKKNLNVNPLLKVIHLLNGFRLPTIMIFTCAIFFDIVYGILTLDIQIRTVCE